MRLCCSVDRWDVGIMGLCDFWCQWRGFGRRYFLESHVEGREFSSWAFSVELLVVISDVVEIYHVPAPVVFSVTLIEQTG